MMRLFPCEKNHKKGNVHREVCDVYSEGGGGGERSSVSFVLQFSCKTDLKSLFEVEIFKLSVSSNFLPFCLPRPSITHMTD